MDCQQRRGGYIHKALLLLFPSVFVFSLQNQAPGLQGCFPLSATPSPLLSSLHCDCERLEKQQMLFVTRMPCHVISFTLWLSQTPDHSLDGLSDAEMILKDKTNWGKPVIFSLCVPYVPAQLGLIAAHRFWACSTLVLSVYRRSHSWRPQFLLFLARSRPCPPGAGMAVARPPPSEQTLGRRRHTHVGKRCTKTMQKEVLKNRPRVKFVPHYQCTD